MNRVILPALTLFALTFMNSAHGQDKPKDVQWTHAFDLACRKFGEAEFSPSTQRFGVEAENRPLETAAWFSDGQDTGNFELIVAPAVEYMDDPDMFLGRYVTDSTQNWARFSDPRVDDLFSRQARSLDPTERKRLITRREKMMQDLVRLENDHRKGKVDASRYGTRREELIAALEHIYGALDSDDAGPPTSLAGLAA